MLFFTLLGRVFGPFGSQVLDKHYCHTSHLFFTFLINRRNQAMPPKSDPKSRIASGVGVARRSFLFLGPCQAALIIPCLLLWLYGCGRPAAVAPSAQVLAQIDSQAKQNRLSEQLASQVAPKASTTDYTDYKVGPEDVLEISCLDTEKLNAEVRVSGQGDIRVQLLGDVPVAGLTASEISKKLANLYREGNYLKDPNIRVAVKGIRHQKVAVTGAVNKPDEYSLIGPRFLLEVLGMAGGLSDKAGETAHVIRPQKKSSISAKFSKEPFSQGTETIVVDLNRLLRQGAMQLNYTIQNGDVVHVPYAQTAYVLGSVARPGGVSIKDNLTVSKAVAQAGGQHILLSSNNATILRLDDSGQRQTIKVNLAYIAKGREDDVPLNENDIVFVQENSLRRALFDFKMLLPGSVSVAPAAF